jgi:hypothetical protein
MPIARFLEKASIEENASFEPDEIKVLVGAFEAALRTLQVDRDDPASVALAKAIIELARQGERDPLLLRQRALQSIGKSP